MAGLKVSLICLVFMASVKSIQVRIIPNTEYIPANIKWMLPKIMASVNSNQVLKAKRHFVDRAFPP